MLVVPDVAHLTYLRHRKGGAKLFDTSEACSRTYADRASEICEDSSVWRSRVVASRIINSTVSDAVIDSSVVAYSLIAGGTIINSEIAAEYIGQNCRIEGSSILGKSRVAHSAVVHNCKFRNLTVTGSAKLLDWPQDADDCFDGFGGYISRGVWHRPPRVFVISPTITVTESIPGFAFVHCREHSIEHWLKRGKRYAKTAGWSDADHLAVRKVIHELQRTT